LLLLVILIGKHERKQDWISLFDHMPKNLESRYLVSYYLGGKPTMNVKIGVQIDLGDGMMDVPLSPIPLKPAAALTRP